MLACALAAGGCRTMILGTSQRILVSTYPSGAQCTLVNRSAEAPVIVAMTPGEIEVQRSNSPLEVRCAKYGHLDVAEAHAHIREKLSESLGAAAAAKMRILYGGSVKPSNAVELLGVKNVDGALVGGASLKAADFLGIAEAYRNIA